MKACYTFILIAAVVAAFCPMGGASANVRVLPRRFSDFEAFGIPLRHPVSNVWVEGIEIAWVNYAALRRDFPKLREYSEAQIDELIRRNVSYISEHQLDLVGLRNTEIPADLSRRREAQRFAAYGRADIMPFYDFDGSLLGLIDRKGAGVNAYKSRINRMHLEVVGAEALQTMDHSDGLMTLGEAIVETTRQRARQRLYSLAGVSAETVESYFVWKFPFGVLKGGGTVEPAGGYGRQAHFERTSFNFNLEIQPNSERYGTQFDSFGAAVDQGLVKIIDPRLASTFGAFRNRSGPQASADWAWAHETARAFKTAQDRWMVEGHIAHMTSPLDELGPDHIGHRGDSCTNEVEQFLRKFEASSLLEERAYVARVLGGRVDLRAIVGTNRFMALLDRYLGDPTPQIRILAYQALKKTRRQERAHLLRHLKVERNDRAIEAMGSAFLEPDEIGSVFDSLIAWVNSKPADQHENFRLALRKTIERAFARHPQLREKYLDAVLSRDALPTPCPELLVGATPAASPSAARASPQAP